VIIHELGHGLHDWAAGCISQDNGLSEGIGDWVAASYSISKGHWAPADPQYSWVFDWDGHNPFWQGRVTNWNDSNTWPAGTGGGCLHTCGQYWASSMVDIMEATSRDEAEIMHWEGIKATSCTATHEEAAAAVVQAAFDNNLNYTAACDAFENTGYWTTAGAEPLVCQQNVLITKEALTDPAPAGGNLTFRITVTNNLTTMAADVWLNDLLQSTMPGGSVVNYVSDTCGGGMSGGTWQYNVGNMELRVRQYGLWALVELDQMEELSLLAL